MLQKFVDVPFLRQLTVQDETMEDMQEEKPNVQEENLINLEDD